MGGGVRVDVNDELKLFCNCKTKGRGSGGVGFRGVSGWM